MLVAALLAGILAVMVMILFVNVRVASEVAQAVAAMPKTVERSTPAHVVFTNNLLGVPPLPALLDRPLWLVNTWGFLPFPRCGNWVNRGDPLVQFVVKKPIFGSHTIATVRSPIAGRVIYTNDASPFGGSKDTTCHWMQYLCVIEIPRGETTPVTCREIYAEFLDTIWEIRHNLLKKAPDGSFPEYSDETIRSEFDSLRDSSPSVFSKSIADYQDRIDWLNLNYPHGIGSVVNVMVPEIAEALGANRSTLHTGA